MTQDRLDYVSGIVKALGPAAAAVLVVWMFLDKSQYMVDTFRSSQAEMVSAFREEQREIRSSMERMQDKTTDRMDETMSRVDKRLEAIERAILSQGAPRLTLPAASTATHYTPR